MLDASLFFIFFSIITQIDRINVAKYEKGKKRKSLKDW